MKHYYLLFQNNYDGENGEVGTDTWLFKIEGEAALKSTQKWTNNSQPISQDEAAEYVRKGVKLSFINSLGQQV